MVRATCMVRASKNMNNTKSKWLQWLLLITFELITVKLWTNIPEKNTSQTSSANKIVNQEKLTSRDPMRKSKNEWTRLSREGRWEGCDALLLWLDVGTWLCDASPWLWVTSSRIPAALAMAGSRQSSTTYGLDRSGPRYVAICWATNRRHVLCLSRPPQAPSPWARTSSGYCKQDKYLRAEVS